MSECRAAVQSADINPGLGCPCRPYLFTTVRGYGGGGLLVFNDTVGGPRSILVWRAMSVLERKALMRLSAGMHELVELASSTNANRHPILVWCEQTTPLL